MAVSRRQRTIKFSEDQEQSLVTGGRNMAIQKIRKKPIAVGEPLSIQIGWRDRKPKKLFNVLCTATDDIYISPPLRRVSINAKKLDDGKALRIARDVGFDNLDDFFKFYADRYGYFFRGVLLRWT